MNLNEIQNRFIELIYNNELECHRYSSIKEKTNKNQDLKWYYDDHICDRFFMAFFNIKVVGVNFKKNHGMKGSDVAKEVLNDLESFYPKPKIFKISDLNWGFDRRFNFWKNHLYQVRNLGEIDWFYKKFFSIQEDFKNVVHKNAIKVAGRQLLDEFLDIGYLPRNFADLLSKKLFFDSIMSIVGIIPNSTKRNFNIDIIFHWNNLDESILPLENNKKKFIAKKAEFLNLKQIRRKIKVN